MPEEGKAVGSMGNKRKAAALPHRAILRVKGEDARDFLDKLITADMARVTLNQSIHSALLTPQGKIISDFFVVSAEEADGGGYYLDVPLVAAADLMKRLTLYKLRARVTIEDQSAELGVWIADHCA
jgi:tRNA-modifying protein YgfZ